MSETSTLIGYQGKTIDREALALVPTPLATDTHRPIPHHEIVSAFISFAVCRLRTIAHLLCRHVEKGDGRC
jgi:hypothetical protein